MFVYDAWLATHSYMANHLIENGFRILPNRLNVRKSEIVEMGYSENAEEFLSKKYNKNNDILVQVKNIEKDFIFEQSENTALKIQNMFGLHTPEIGQ